MQPEAQQEIYQAIARALARKQGFRIFFIERSPLIHLHRETSCKT